MNHLVIGDVHGYHHNLRKFLLTNEVIDKSGSAINRDKFQVYSVGDLIDGNYNRAGDLLNLEYAEEWFNQICLGNHEFAFIGGEEFGGRRKHDRKTMQLLLGLIDKGVYVPSILISSLETDYLVTHAGLSERFVFETATDAHEYMKRMWQLTPDLDEDVAIFDWKKGQYQGGDPTSGVFGLDWIDSRNDNFSQIVGHTTYYTGPISKDYDEKVTHWNVDVGAKTGKGVGGILIDDVTGEVKSLFWGERNTDGYSKTKKTVPPAGENMTSPPPPKDPTTTIITPSTVMGPTITPTTQLALTDGSKSSSLYKVLPNVDLADLDISIIKDPEILEVFIEEIRKGNTDLRLRDFFMSPND